MVEAAFLSPGCGVKTAQEGPSTDPQWTRGESEKQALLSEAPEVWGCLLPQYNQPVLTDAVWLSLQTLEKTYITGNSMSNV